MVPAESQVIFFSSPRSVSNLRKVASAEGERQIFPQQTKRICMVFCLPLDLRGFKAESIFDAGKLDYAKGMLIIEPSE